MSNRLTASVLISEEGAGRSTPAAFGGGAIIGALGGLIGLGGTEFRLPLLIGAFRFAALQAVILNKAMSLVVVASALPFRAAAVPFASVAAHWPIIVNLLAGSLLGAWFGASWATRLASHTLYRTIAVLLVMIAVVLVIGHDTAVSGAMLTIDFNYLEVYEAGALLVTLLAYPGESKNDDEQRSRVHASLCGHSPRAL
jgi:uncharacterized protein